MFEFTGYALRRHVSGCHVLPVLSATTFATCWVCHAIAESWCDKRSTQTDHVHVAFSSNILMVL